VLLDRRVPVTKVKRLWEWVAAYSLNGGLEID
jgi:hypothetical protein